jgi:hypothetical protein
MKWSCPILSLQLVELLEVPQLMDACIRNGLFFEAVDLVAFANTLERRHLTRGSAKLSRSLSSSDAPQQNTGTWATGQSPVIGSIVSAVTLYIVGMGCRHGRCAWGADPSLSTHRCRSSEASNASSGRSSCLSCGSPFSCPDVFRWVPRPVMCWWGDGMARADMCLPLPPLRSSAACGSWTGSSWSSSTLGNRARPASTTSRSLSTGCRWGLFPSIWPALRRRS